VQQSARRHHMQFHTESGDDFSSGNQCGANDLRSGDSELAGVATRSTSLAKNRTRAARLRRNARDFYSVHRAEELGSRSRPNGFGMFIGGCAARGDGGLRWRRRWWRRSNPADIPDHDPRDGRKLPAFNYGATRGRLAASAPHPGLSAPAVACFRSGGVPP
jgi:hypothetical protein